MKTPVRLVKKMKLSTNVAFLLICLAGAAGFMMVADDSQEMTAKVDSSPGGLLCLFSASLSHLLSVRSTQYNAETHGKST